MEPQQPEPPPAQQPEPPNSEQPTPAPIAGRELAQLPKRKRGPKPLALDALRSHTVSVRLNPAELADLDSARKLVQMQRGEYLRAASRGVLPPTIPAINREAWANLARATGNLNQFQQAGNAFGYPPDFLENLRDMIALLRAELLGINTENETEHESEN